MKKYFTLFTGLLLGACVQGNAQTTVFQDDFESAAIGSLPANWTQAADPTGGWAVKEGATPFTQSAWTMPAHTRYLMVHDWANTNAKNDSSMLITPVIDLTGVTGAYLGFDYYFIGASRGAGTVESAIVMATTDGVTWDTLKTYNNTSGSTVKWLSSYFSLDKYDNSSTLQIGFFYYDAKSQLIGFAIDDVRVYVPGTDEAKLQQIILPMFTGKGLAADGTVLRFSADNVGTDPITELEVEYSLDGGTAVSHTFTGLNVATGSNIELAFPNGVSGIGSGDRELNLTITKVNDAADPYMDDNSDTIEFLGATAVKERPCFMEEFTSSTCAPCASFNAYFDPMIDALGVNTAGANFNIIKYQMNWPNPRDDRSYNSHGATRQMYYGVNSIPKHFAQGLTGGNGSQAEIDGCKGGTSPFEINGTYTVVDGESLKVDVSVTPFADFTGNYTVHIAAVEKQYNNAYAATSQKDYLHVMRMMFPNGNGSRVSSWTSGAAQNFNFDTKYTDWESGTEVKQNSFTFWTHPMNSNLVVFVQDNTTKEVLQSAIFEASWPTSVAERTAGLDKVALYPNPATAQTNVLFTLENTADVQIQVVDAVGRTVFVKENKQMNAGSHNVVLNTDAFAAGLYNVRVQTENGAVVKRLSVVK